jgi:hypothetical protein
MKKKTISLRGISEILNEKELKSVVGGSNGPGGCCIVTCNDGAVSPQMWPCNAYLYCWGNIKEIFYPGSDCEY